MIATEQKTAPSDLLQHLISLVYREPDFYIGGKGDPYMRFWWVTSRHPDRFKLYLHHIVRDDDDRALHDHPSASCSIILKGGYF